MIFRTAPEDFNKRFDVVGCYILCDDSFLLLHRHEHKTSGDTWGLPAGKVDEGEELKEALLREVKEETGIAFAPDEVEYFDSVFLRDGNFDMGWHMFSIRVPERPEVVIDPYEHLEYRWVSLAQAGEMNLIHDLAESNEMFFNLSARLGSNQGPSP